MMLLMSLMLDTEQGVAIGTASAPARGADAGFNVIQPAQATMQGDTFSRPSKVKPIGMRQ